MFTSTVIDQVASGVAGVLRDRLPELEKAYLVFSDKFPVSIKLVFMPSDKGDLEVKVTSSFDTGEKISDTRTIIINEKQMDLPGADV